MKTHHTDATLVDESLTENAIRDRVEQRFRDAQLPYFQIKEIDFIDDWKARVHVVGQSGVTALWLIVDRRTGMIRQYVDRR